MKSNVRNLVYVALFIVLITIGAKVVIPIPVCPFTLQLLFTTLAGLVLGPVYGGISVLCYIVLGLIGVPVFATGGGFGYVLQPTFGYLAGFAAGAFLTGLIAGKNRGSCSFLRLLAANFAGLLVVYLMGIVYFWLIKTFYIGNPIGFKALILYCFVLAVPGDIVLCVVAAILSKKLLPILKANGLIESEAKK
ncbi:biotin transporter BioY [uncultured Treponema sp.]|uniref:biotin transporter BioY n=1 Tax=uncultured Treponema sp. TaxID=162155 RepID=UPI0025915A24|nr:biotin transporter BioY [uncultured Treponema sp.]